MRGCGSGESERDECVLALHEAREVVAGEPTRPGAAAACSLGRIDGDGRSPVAGVVPDGRALSAVVESTSRVVLDGLAGAGNGRTVRVLPGTSRRRPKPGNSVHTGEGQQGGPESAHAGPDLRRGVMGAAVVPDGSRLCSPGTPAPSWWRCSSTVVPHPDRCRNGQKPRLDAHVGDSPVGVPDPSAGASTLTAGDPITCVIARQLCLLQESLSSVGPGRGRSAAGRAHRHPVGWESQGTANPSREIAAT